MCLKYDSGQLGEVSLRPPPTIMNFSVCFDPELYEIIAIMKGFFLAAVPVRPT